MNEQRERPYDPRWGDPKAVEREFHLSPTVLKAGFCAGWIKARQPSWKDDEHRAQVVYCFEDIHRYVEEVLHQVTGAYVKRFWTTQELKDAAAVVPRGPYKGVSISVNTTTKTK